MSYQLISIEGNIGAGKTTLARMLAQHFQGRLILEQFADNPFLPRFYEDPARFAFPLEMFFLAGRHQQLKEVLQARDLFSRPTICDYLFSKSMLFARVNLRDEEYRLYQKLFDILGAGLAQPDLLVYLHAPVSRCEENIRKRNRSYEKQISREYLSNLQEAYSQYIGQRQMNTLVVDVSEGDFEHDPKQFGAIVEALERGSGIGRQYISLS